MGKLVIYLADGGTMEVPLRKERVTIGRRPDNDVCLPFPAVSGEHAQVVTILADSFLEDLGSTNGTLVNGKAVAKHFLRNNDSIDIGRQRLSYLDNDEATVEALPPDIRLRQLRGMVERVDSVKPTPKPAPVVGAQTGPMRGSADTEDLEHVLSAGSPAREEAAVMQEPVALRATPRGLASASQTELAVAKADISSSGGPVPAVAPAIAASAASPRAPSSATSLVAPAPPPAARLGPSVRVLSGASQGRTVAFPGAELTVGRVGVQVAVVRRLDGGGYLLIPLEGRDAPKINGAPVSPEGSSLHPGDTFEVAGVRLELSVHS